MSERAPLSSGSLLVLPGAIARDADRILKLLRDSDDPAEIVSSLGSPDLLLLLRKADDHERGELLALASADQLREVVDLACWRRDRFDGEALEELLGPLVEQGFDGTTKALRDIDDEVRFLLLRRHAVVHLRESRDDDFFVDDASEAIESPDGFYLVELPDPAATSDLIRQLFQAMFLAPFAEYQPELEALRHELVSETEERAIAFRRGRLADLGFGTREEGLALLAPRSPEQVRMIVKQGTPVPPVPSDLPLPALYRGGLSGSALLDAALARVGQLASRPGGLDDRRMRKALALEAELGAMTSLLISAMDCDLGDPEELSRRVVWARDLLTLGLEVTFDGDADLAALGLLSQAPGLFVQAAMGLLAPLGGRAQRLMADRRLVAGGRRAGLLDPPHLAAVEAAAREIPARWPLLDEGLDLSAEPLTPLPWEFAAFSTSEEVQRAARLIEEAEAVAAVLVGRLGFAPPDEDGATASRLLMNALGHAFAGREPRPAPLSAADAHAFVERVLAAAEEDLLGETLDLFQRLTGCRVQDTSNPLATDDPLARLLARLVLIGRARLAGGEGLLLTIG